MVDITTTPGPLPELGAATYAAMFPPSVAISISLKVNFFSRSQHLISPRHGGIYSGLCDVLSSARSAVRKVECAERLQLFKRSLD
jgi:hypothetical protein